MTISDNASSIPDTLNQAVAQHQRGDLAGAERRYQEILAVDPNNADALHLMGVLAHQTGRIQLAVESIRRATSLAANHALYHYNLAGALKDAGLIDEAIGSYQEALERKPQFFEAWLNLGAAYQKQNRLREATACYDEALKLDPENAEVFSNLGTVLNKLRHFDDAAECYRKAISLKPDFAEAHSNLGGTLHELRDCDAAIRSYQRAIQIRPDYMAAHHNLGQVLHDVERFDEAVKHYRRALELSPGSYETHVNLGSVLHDQQKYNYAVLSFNNALKIRPDGYEALNNLGRAYQELGRLPEALEAYDAALAIAPEDGETHLNRALLLLQLGRFSEGWTEYEWRWRTQRHHRKRDLSQPRWEGANLAGKSILIHGEQGIGDEIMFASCYPDVIERADRCVITCDERLAALFARSFSAAEIIPVTRGGEDWSEQGQLPVDYQIAAGCLPRFLRPDAASFPCREEYLLADPARRARWEARYAELGAGLKIGISWRAGVKQKERHMRSTSLDEWLPVVSLPGIHFVNLQYGDCVEEIAAFRERTKIAIHDWDDSDALTDIDDFAAQLTALDLVISVGNATVHLAGSLGVPTWNLLPRWWGWRWLVDSIDNPWYPHVQTIRQTQPGNWPRLFDQVAAELSSRLKLLSAVA